MDFGFAAEIGRAQEFSSITYRLVCIYVYFPDKVVWIAESEQLPQENAKYRLHAGLPDLQEWFWWNQVHYDPGCPAAAKE